VAAGGGNVAIEVVIFIAVVFGIASGLILERFRMQIDEHEQRKADAKLPALSFSGNRLPAVSQPVDVDRLRNVSDAQFSPKRLMSDNESIVLAEVESIIADIGCPWRVLAQVSLSQAVASSSAEALLAIEGQQIALLIVDPDRTPIAAIEYQPLGQVRSEDALRNAIKREALRRANIAYIEVRSSDQPGDLRHDITALASRQRALAEAPPRVAPAPAPAPAADTSPPAKPRKPRGRSAAGGKP
jgi:hypothetical protein